MYTENFVKCHHDKPRCKHTGHSHCNRAPGCCPHHSTPAQASLSAPNKPVAQTPGNTWLCLDIKSKAYPVTYRANPAAAVAGPLDSGFMPAGAAEKTQPAAMDGCSRAAGPDGAHRAGEHSGHPYCPSMPVPEAVSGPKRPGNCHRMPTGHSGLLHYRKWWERTEVGISVSGTFITGIPIFAEENTLRVVNDQYSYFIPLEKVDYIRTGDGLRSSVEPEQAVTE